MFWHLDCCRGRYHPEAELRDLSCIVAVFEGGKSESTGILRANLIQRRAYVDTEDGLL